MPIARFQMPDGRVGRFEVPDGTTPEQAQQLIAQSMSGGVDRAAIAEDMKRLADPLTGVSGVEKFLAGTGKAFTDIGRGLGQTVGLVSKDDVAESRRLDQPLMRTGAGMAGNVVGNVVAAAPTMAIPGANSIVGGTLVGAGMGALQPSVSNEETLKNLALGGLTAGAVPAAFAVGRTGKALLEPMYQGGRNKIMGRTLMQAAGGDAEKAIQNLSNARELVPGSAPTAGEAAGNPGIASLQRTASAIDPVAMNQMAARQVAQNDARQAALGSIAPDIDASKMARESATSALYRSTEDVPVKMTDDLVKLVQRPSMSKAFTRASQLAAEAGESIDPSALTGKSAHYIKMALDDLANASPATGIGGNELRAIKSTRADYLSALEKQIPDYGKARTAYSEMSRPINQAEIADEITRKATSFRGEITPSAYARALSDTTAQRVTGQPNASLARVMEPDQLAQLQAIKDDLLRSDFAKTAGKGIGSDTVQKMAFNNILNEVGVPSAVRGFAPAGVIGNVAKGAGQLLYKDANDRMASELAQALMNPQLSAQLMKSAMVNPRSAQLVNALKSGGATLGVSSPGIIQGLQQ